LVTSQSPNADCYDDRETRRSTTFGRSSRETVAISELNIKSRAASWRPEGEEGKICGSSSAVASCDRGRVNFVARLAATPKTIHNRIVFR